MPTHPYIHFQGQCAEALTAYAALFGGTDLQIMRYTDGPPVPEAWKGSPRVMHGQVTLGTGTLMASDYPPGVEGEAQNGFSVMHSAPDVATGKTWFDGLSKGGAIIEDYKATFFSPGFGMVRDRFGTRWIISTVA